MLEYPQTVATLTIENYKPSFMEIMKARITKADIKRGWMAVSWEEYNSYTNSMAYNGVLRGVYQYTFNGLKLRVL